MAHRQHQRGNRENRGSREKNVLSQVPRTKCNFTKCPHHPQTTAAPGNTQECGCQDEEAGSDIHLSLSARTPFDTLPALHTHLDAHSETQGSANMPEVPGLPAPSPPPQQGASTTHTQRGLPGPSQPLWLPPAPPVGPSLARLRQHPRIFWPLVIIPLAHRLPAHTSESQMWPPPCSRLRLLSHVPGPALRGGPLAAHPSPPWSCLKRPSSTLEY